MELANRVVWVYALSIVLLSLISRATRIEIDPDGGYRKIVVAIPERVPQSEKTLEDLKAFLRDVSTKLHTASKKRVYFKEIQILVPNSWTKYSVATFENYVEADIRVDIFNPLPDKGEIYTHQPRGCGERGDFIYLNPSATSKDNVKKFVVEWSKFRYGVFDESGYDNELYPNEYPYEKEKSIKTGCSLPEKSFTSIMDGSNSTGEAYCDDTNDHIHNKYAPTPQNVLCNLKSTWEVVSSSPDFEIANKAPRDLSNKTNFNIVRASPMQVVFVIDPSLSDRFGTKGSHMLELTLQQFFADFPSNGKIGFIIANGQENKVQLESGDQKQHMKRLKDLADKANKQSVKIKDGVEKGIDMILQSPSKNGHLIVISDGPKLNPKDFQSAFVKLDNLTFFLLTWTPISTKLQYEVENMKEFVEKPSRCLWMDIRVESSILNCDTKARIQIEDAVALFFARFENQDFYPKKIKIYEDVTLSGLLNRCVNPVPGSELIFNMYFCNVDSDDKRLTLKFNDNEVSDVSKHDMVTTLLATYTMPNTPREIEYEWNIVHSQNYTPTSSVWVKIENNIQPEVVFSGAIETASIQKYSQIPLKFFAFSPNKNKVTLEIMKRDNVTFISDSLWDNGNGDPDVMANDKIFTRYFFNTSAKDCYSCRMIADDNNGKFISSIGTFYLPPRPQSTYPPNSIKDFRVHEISKDKVVLKWTAPGGNLDHGIVQNYDVNCSTDFNCLEAGTYAEKESTQPIPLPVQAGQEQQLNWEWKTPIDDSGTYYCAIIATNKDNKRSERSNIISFRKPNNSQQLHMSYGMIFITFLPLYYAQVISTK